MVISLFLLKNSSALELSLNSPNIIELNKEFQVKIDIDSEEIYDVKVFVHNSPDSGVTRNEYISQIFNTEKNTWQSSWNYLLSSYPKEKEYKLNITESSGERKICARVRKTGTNSSISKCNSISVSGGQVNEEINNAENEENNTKLNDDLDKEIDNNEEKESNNKDNEEKDNIQAQDNKNAENINSNSNNFEELSSSKNEQPNYENEEIILKPNKDINSDKIKDLENEIYATKKQKTTLSIFYIFNILLAFIIILIILKKV